MNVKEIERAIKTHHGHVTAAAQELRISRACIYDYLKKYPKLQAILDNERESTLDKVEHVLVEKALEGEAWAVCFFLKTQGKRRGYIERQEIIAETQGQIVLVTGTYASKPAQ